MSAATTSASACFADGRRRPASDARGGRRHLVAQLEHEALGGLLADAGHLAQHVGAAAGDRERELRVVERGEQAERNARADAADADQLLEQHQVVARGEAEQRERVFAHVEVRVERRRRADRRAHRRRSPGRTRAGRCRRRRRSPSRRPSPRRRREGALRAWACHAVGDVVSRRECIAPAMASAAHRKCIAANAPHALCRVKPTAVPAQLTELPAAAVLGEPAQHARAVRRAARRVARLVRGAVEIGPGRAQLLDLVIVDPALLRRRDRRRRGAPRSARRSSASRRR